MGKLKKNRASRFGRKPDWKRAIVTLKEGSKIDLS
jgi:ribosomal protein L23